MSKNVLEKFLLLRPIHPFSSLTINEISVIASVTTFNTYESGEVLGLRGAYPKKLNIVVGGTLVSDRGELAVLHGFHEILLAKPFPDQWKAGSDGVQLLQLTKAHFLKIIHEFPILLLEQLAVQRQGRVVVK